MGRILVATLIASACLLPSLTQAQTSSPSGGTVAPAPPTGGVPRGGSFGVTTRQNPPPPPSPPPQAGPVVPPAPPSALDRADIFRATPRTYAPRFDRVSRRDRFFGYGGFGYITDPFGYISQPDSSSPALDRYMRNEQGTGYLRLEVEPDTAQVYVDDLYAGTVADFRRGGRALDVGPHRVEIRADGYEPQGVELRIRSNDTLSYRGTLTRRDDRAEVRTAAATPKTFYVIPRCYAGTSRPRAEQLPPGCRISDVRTVPPVVEPSRRQ